MSDKTAVIVGAGPGMGRAIARRFAREGFQLALMARRAAMLEELASELHETGTEALTVAIDAAQKHQVEKAFALVLDRLGDVDVLVYNAAVIVPVQPSRLKPEDALGHFQINVLGALVCAQEVIPYMREQKAGTILFTGGGLALNPRAEYASLAMGKAALRSLAYSMAQELAPDGIHVATVTIDGPVEAGTHFDPDTIAEEYWKLHNQPPSEWQTEVVFREPGGGRMSRRPPSRLPVRP